MKPSEGRSHPIHQQYRQRRVFPCEVSASANIAAPMDAVWRVLVDFPHYGDWNPFTPAVEGALAVGERVTMQVDMPGRSTSVRTEVITLVEPGQTLCWGMKIGHATLLVANRWQTLERLENGHTRYRTVDRFSGLLVPLVMALYGGPMQRGFQSVADGLKRRVETETGE